LTDLTQIELRSTTGSYARQREAAGDDTYQQHEEPANHVEKSLLDEPPDGCTVRMEAPLGKWTSTPLGK
jgi:hypothetical protein